jgi:hypothetical protein
MESSRTASTVARNCAITRRVPAWIASWMESAGATTSWTGTTSPTLQPVEGTGA